MYISWICIDIKHVALLVQLKVLCHPALSSRVPKQDSAMAFVLPRAQKGQGKKGTAAGRKTWAVGEKLWENAVVHKAQGFLRKYPGVPASDDGGASSSARWECLGKPAAWLSPMALAASLDSGNTELINRPGIGFSELASVLHCQDCAIREGVRDEILHPALLAKWDSLWCAHELAAAVKVLNAIGFPDISRSSVEVKTAVSNMLKFAQAVRGDWEAWSSVFAFGTTLTVCNSWLLSVAALTCPGVFAKAVVDVPMKAAPGTKAALLADPSNGQKLRNLLIDEISAQHNVKALLHNAAVPVPVPLPELNFDSSQEAPEEDHAVAHVNATPVPDELRNVIATVLGLSLPTGAGGRPPKRKRLQQTETMLEEHKKVLKELYEGHANSVNPAAVPEIESALATLKSLRREVQRLLQAQ